jgi:hypothetical protein
MNGYEIPLLAQPQTLTVTLLGVVYQFLVQWNVPLQTWLLDISDSQGNPIVQGLALVTGVDILGQFQYLGIGGALIVQSSGGDPLAAPTFDNLGTTALLFFIPYGS